MIASQAIAVRVPRPAATRPSPPPRPLHRPAPVAAQLPNNRPALALAASLPLASLARLPGNKALLPAAVFTLKLLASALAGTTVTLLLLPDARKSAPPRQERFAFDVGQESIVYAHRRTQHLTRGEEAAD